MMAHGGGKDTHQQQLLQPHLQRHHHQQQRAQQQHQRRLDVDDLSHVCAPGARNQTSIVATPQDLRRSCSGYHQHHGGGAAAFSNRLIEPKEVKINYNLHALLGLLQNYCMVACCAVHACMDHD